MTANCLFAVPWIGVIAVALSFPPWPRSSHNTTRGLTTHGHKQRGLQKRASFASSASNCFCLFETWVDEIRDPDRGKFNHSMQDACMHAGEQSGVRKAGVTYAGLVGLNTGSCQLDGKGMEKRGRVRKRATNTT